LVRVLVAGPRAAAAVCVAAAIRASRDALSELTLLAGRDLKPTVPARQRRTLAVTLATTVAKRIVRAVTVLADFNMVVAAGSLTGALLRITGLVTR
jgi:hypothetical protein